MHLPQNKYNTKDYTAMANLTKVHSYSWNEKLWLLGDVVCQLGNEDMELTDECIEASEAIKQLDRNDTISSIAGLVAIKFRSHDSDISEWNTSEFVIDCGETWGDRLDELSTNEALWLVYQGVYEKVDALNLPNREELDDIAEYIECGGLDRYELTRMCADLTNTIYEEYFTN